MSRRDWLIVIVFALIMVLTMTGCSVSIGPSDECDGQEQIPNWCKP